MTRQEAELVLGLVGGETPDQIRKAAQRSAMDYHPDRGGYQAQMQRVLQARDILLGGDDPNPSDDHQPPPRETIWTVVGDLLGDPSVQAAIAGFASRRGQRRGRK